MGKWTWPLLVVIALLVTTPATGQGPLPREKSCEEERDQLRILSRMLGDQRGQLELMVSEVLARAHRAEAEIARLKAAMTPPSEKK